MYSMKDAVVRNLEFMEENLRLKADVKRFAEINEQLIEDNEALKKKVHFYENTDLAKEHSHFVNECDLLREREAKLLKGNEELQKKIEQLRSALDNQLQRHSCLVATSVNDQNERDLFRTENERLEKELKKALTDKESVEADAYRCGKLIEDLQEEIGALSDDNNNLRDELIDERDRFDRLSDFELAEAKELERAKTMFNIAFSYLDQTGYDVEKLGMIVGLRMALMERGLV